MNEYEIIDDSGLIDSADNLDEAYELFDTVYDRVDDIKGDVRLVKVLAISH